LLHHGTLLKIDTHYTDTGGASDHVFIHNNPNAVRDPMPNPKNDPPC
jgi:hypothetical protein